MHRRPMPAASPCGRNVEHRAVAVPGPTTQEVDLGELGRDEGPHVRRRLTPEPAGARAPINDVYPGLLPIFPEKDRTPGTDDVGAPRQELLQELIQCRGIDRRRRG